MYQRPLHEPAEQRLPSRIESILLVAGGPVSLKRLAQTLQVSAAEVRAGVQELAQELRLGTRLQFDRDHVQLVSAPENAEDVHRFLGTSKPPALSRAALETLTVIAYRQPVTRPEIEAVRGVNSDRALLTLLTRELVQEVGTRETPGRPAEYGTTFGFLEYFGLSSLADLPPLDAADQDEHPPESIGLRPV